MSYTKQILCLANSWKHAGRCIAGREIEAAGTIGDWIRPVSGRPGEEISEQDYVDEHGHAPKLLDVISIDMLEPRPHGWQHENHLNDDQRYWTFVRRASWAEVNSAVEDLEGPLWTNEDGSSYNGINDRVAVSRAEEFNWSLCLIRPKDLHIVVADEGPDPERLKRKARAQFEYNGELYKIVITDPVVAGRYQVMGLGVYPLSDAILCVSLGEGFGSYAYKLAAAVITPDRVRTG